MATTRAEADFEQQRTFLRGSLEGLRANHQTALDKVKTNLGKAETDRDNAQREMDAFIGRLDPLEKLALASRSEGTSITDFFQHGMIDAIEVQVAADPNNASLTDAAMSRKKSEAVSHFTSRRNELSEGRDGVRRLEERLSVAEDRITAKQVAKGELEETIGEFDSSIAEVDGLTGTLDEKRATCNRIQQQWSRYISKQLDSDAEHRMSVSELIALFEALRAAQANFDRPPPPRPRPSGGGGGGGEPPPPPPPDPDRDPPVEVQEEYEAFFNEGANSSFRDEPGFQAAISISGNVTREQFHQISTKLQDQANGRYTVEGSVGSTSFKLQDSDSNQTHLTVTQKAPADGLPGKIDFVLGDANDRDKSIFLMVLSAKEVLETMGRKQFNIEHCETNPEVAIKMYLIGKTLGLEPSFKDAAGQTLNAIRNSSLPMKFNGETMTLGEVWNRFLDPNRENAHALGSPEEQALCAQLRDSLMVKRTTPSVRAAVTDPHASTSGASATSGSANPLQDELRGRLAEITRRREEASASPSSDTPVDPLLHSADGLAADGRNPVVGPPAPSAPVQNPGPPPPLPPGPIPPDDHDGAPPAPPPPPSFR